MRTPLKLISRARIQLRIPKASDFVLLDSSCHLELRTLHASPGSQQYSWPSDAILSSKVLIVGASAGKGAPLPRTTRRSHSCLILAGSTTDDVQRGHGQIATELCGVGIWSKVALKQISYVKIVEQRIQTPCEPFVGRQASKQAKQSKARDSEERKQSKQRTQADNKSRQPKQPKRAKRSEARRAALATLFLPHCGLRS